MKIVGMLAPMAAEAGTPGVPLWQKVVLAALSLTVVAAVLVVWAAVRLVKSKRESSRS